MSKITIPWDELTTKQKESLIKEHSLESLHNSYLDKTIAFFEREKKILNLKPRFKDEHSVDEKTIENPPSLEIIKHRSLLISPEMAIIEFLDNIFDNYIKNLRMGKLDQSLKIELIFYESNHQNILLIRENSGGIHPDDILPLVKPGESGKNDNKNTIGTWGEAFLYSCYSLGSDVTVYSFHENGKPFSIPIDQNFFNSEKWVLKKKTCEQFDGIKNLDKGWTVFEINNVYKYTTNELALYEELKAEIEDTYWKKASEIYDMGYNVSITINPYFSRTVVVEFDFFEINRAFSHYPYCLPIVVQDYEIGFSDEHGIKGSIFVDAYCGINPFDKDHNLAKYKGVCMWGNGRLFEKNRKDTSVGYNVSSTGIRLSQRHLFNHLSILLFFKSKKKEWNKYIPWKIPTKKGFNSESILKKEILKLISLLAKRFIYPLDQLYGGNRFIFEIFSYDFIEKSEDEKFEYLFKEMKKAQNRNELYPDIDWKSLTEKKKELTEDDKEELKNVLAPFFGLENDHIHDSEKYKGDILGLEKLNSRNIEFNDATKSFSTLLGKSKEDPGYIRTMIEHFLETGFLPIVEDEEEEEEEEREIETEVIEKAVEKEEKEIIREEEKVIKTKLKNEITLSKTKEEKDKIQEENDNKIKSTIDLTRISSKEKLPKKDYKKAKQPYKRKTKVKEDISTKLQKSVKTSKQNLKRIREQKVTVSVKLELEKDHVKKLKKILELSPNTSAKRTIYVLIDTFLEDIS